MATEQLQEKEPLTSNVFKTALLFEGGSMRAAYTCAVVVKLLEEGVYFDNVYGVSAGSSNTVNYLSRDLRRSHVVWTELLGNPKVGSWKTFLQHKGLYDAQYIYEEMGKPEGEYPFDLDTFMRNPAKFCIVSCDRATGEPLYFRREDVKCLNDLMVRVRASSTLPIFMPPPVVDGVTCYDGGFETGGGLPIQRILDDGFDRMVIVRTRPRGFRRKPGSEGMLKYFMWRFPKFRDVALARTERYNKMCDLIDQLEAEGRAYVFYSDEITLSGQERDVALLEENYQKGYAQITREWSALKAFIDAGE